MSIKFSFRRRSDNKLIPIDDIDKQLNEDLKRIYIKTDAYSKTLLLVTTIGDLCLINNGNKWNEQNFKIIIRDLFFSDKEIAVIKNYLYGEYIYDSWR
jgi:hypothetical protein